MTFTSHHILLRAMSRWCAALAFCLPLKPRPGFRFRVLVMLLPLIALTWAVDPEAQSSSLVQLQFLQLVLYACFFVLLGLMVHACVEIDWHSAFYCSVWSLLSSQASYECWKVAELACAYFNKPLDTGTLPVKLIQILSACVFYFGICNVLSRKMAGKDGYHIGPRQLISAFGIGILFMLQAALLNSSQALNWPPSFVITVLIGQFYFLSLLYFQTEIFKKVELQKEMDTLNLLYERQRQQYQIARQNVQIINKRCHELKVQIASLRQMAPALSGTALERRIDEAEEAAQLYNANCNTGNEVLDVVLTEKSLLCLSRRIRLSAVANGSCLNFFEAADLYALFANILDHAIESAVQMPQPERRAIDLLVCVRQSFVVINVISPARPPEAADTRNTQYVIKVAKRIVQKYKGTVTTETQNGFFAVKIIFPYSPGKTE